MRPCRISETTRSDTAGKGRARENGVTDINLESADKEVFRRLSSTGRISNALRRVMTQHYNRCSLCSKFAEHGRPVFAGYSETSEPIVVCAGCAEALKELATPVYWSGTLDISFDEDRTLWRYMDFSKFVAMMQQGGIYFTRAAKFDDRFEAAAGVATKEAVWDEHYLTVFRMAVTTPPPGHPTKNMTDAEVDKEASRLLREVKTAYASARDLLVSCWHLNSVETEALWKIYCSPGAPGVAVQTSAACLWNAMENEAGANIGKVQYVDFKKGFASGDQRIFCKRSSLSYENEVRVVLPNDKGNPLDGRLVNCDLGKLVQNVVISPYGRCCRTLRRKDSPRESGRLRDWA